MRGGGPPLSVGYPRRRRGCGERAEPSPRVLCKAVVRQILAHLGLSTATPSLRAPPDPPEGLVADPPRAWSSEPLLNDLPAADPVLA